MHALSSMLLSKQFQFHGNAVTSLSWRWRGTGQLQYINTEEYLWLPVLQNFDQQNLIKIWRCPRFKITKTWTLYGQWDKTV